MLGAASVGLLVGMAIQAGINLGASEVIATKANVEFAIGRTIYEESIALGVLASVVPIVLGGVFAGYAARRGRGQLAGLLSVAPWLLIFAAALVVLLSQATDMLVGRMSAQLFFSILLVLFTAGGLAGGWLGDTLRRFVDLDAPQVHVTFVGIRWYHYLWLLVPIYLHTATAVLFFVAIVHAFASFEESMLLAVLVHLPLAMVYAVGIPLAKYLTAHDRRSRWGLLWRALLLGVIGPLFAYIASTYAIDAVLATYADVSVWAIAVVVVIYGGALIFAFWDWIREQQRLQSALHAASRAENISAEN